jgi:murein DD-endopeptidase MepM/ murein hydrolase activator NlpD
MTWINPLVDVEIHLPPPHGRFGARRRYDVHTGIDLYAPVETKVRAVESGMVVAIDYFTGPIVDMPWWNNTKAVLIEGKSGVVCYGEVIERFGLLIGDKIKQGEVIAQVVQVLKEDKGLPMSMLHLELHRDYHRNHIWHPWKLDGEMPEYLLDPTIKLPLT